MLFFLCILSLFDGVDEDRQEKGGIERGRCSSLSNFGVLYLLASSPFVCTKSQSNCLNQLDTVVLADYTYTGVNGTFSGPIFIC